MAHQALLAVLLTILAITTVTKQTNSGLFFSSPDSIIY